MVEWLRSFHGSLDGRVVKIVSRERGWSSCEEPFTAAWMVEWIRSFHGKVVGRVVTIASRELGWSSG